MWKNTDDIILTMQEYKRSRGKGIKILDFTRIGHSIINQRRKQNQKLNMLKRKKRLMENAEKKSSRTLKKKKTKENTFI